ncbi:glycosyl hydrolase 115 family protein [Parapedobacter sp. ISTM3]|uniref:glycosyl hydrolase 115 family protein n=1 Tax=Parapedobacter sp. ISTM3 TaxID=2800130 RepID=UPI001908B63F|nr:glycosyl hydrolase 115 family protein [Parapedobacter sp. ISTM3]MBK1439540.1 glycosyl hydrolase 115 family protein [Parapedobacter sp. ISTM3]
MYRIILLIGYTWIALAAHAANPGFPLVSNHVAANIMVDSSEHRSVLRAAGDLQLDIERVSSVRPTLNGKHTSTAIIIGTVGKSRIIDKLIHSGAINVADIVDQWESTLIEVVDNPTPDIAQALVIAGSDNRGTIFGIYDISYQIGVSPWHFWADVPVKKSDELFFNTERAIRHSPAVKYRGIFINDGAPALAGWAEKYHGGFTHTFYEKVFELILRLRGNFLWPAMWGRAFNDDDPLNPVLASQYGIVLGTSHHEPMVRAHDEWRRYGAGPWDYQTNKHALQVFWKEGIRRMGAHENLVTIGMRGDGDEPMTEGTAIELLETIVADQRQIIEEVTEKKATAVPQVWALYKEVQDYYDHGMRVPDDVTLLLCDDNWGNIRKLPKLSDPPRSGGYGIYYHFDYVGGPRNYKWLNTNPITKVWEQMNLAYQYGATQLWIVNVGDIKPMEFPTEFFLDMAWSPQRWDATQLQEYTVAWARKQFGGTHAQDIADFLAQYTKFNGRRKPELLDAGTYSLHHYREWERVAADYNILANRAQAVNDQLAPEYRDAYYQLVLFPILACANLYELYYTVAKNTFYASQRRAATNTVAERAEVLFARDSLLTHQYNNVMAGGKWSHMMDQTHIGYTYWQQPEKNVLPEVQRLTLPAEARMGVHAEGQELHERQEQVLPELDPYFRDSAYIEIFNQGADAFFFQAASSADWVRLSETSGTISDELRLWAHIDWANAPMGNHAATIHIKGAGQEKRVTIRIHHYTLPTATHANTFIENSGYIAMEAHHYSQAVNANGIHWQVLPDYGRTESAVTAMPVTAASLPLSEGSPHLVYRFRNHNTGDAKVTLHVSPTLNFSGENHLRLAVSIDGQAPLVININEDESENAWSEGVANNIKRIVSHHALANSGEHALKVWFIDPGVVLQRVVIDLGGEQPSYLGPPESWTDRLRSRSNASK